MGIVVILKSDFPEIMGRARDLAEAATGKAAHDIEGHAKGRAPVKTGHLRSSINAYGGGLEWYVEVGANYGGYVEFGTRKMAARPYFIPAIEQTMPSYLAAMRRIIR